MWRSVEVLKGFAVLFAVMYSPCASQSLLAELHMQGVIGRASLTRDNKGDLKADITLTTNINNVMWLNTTVDILPMFTYYDTRNACATAQLGNLLRTKSDVDIDSNIPTNVSVYLGGISDIYDVEGHSIRLSSEGTLVCATIQRRGNYLTAVAELRNTLFGTVYFRQFETDASVPTRIVSSLQTADGFNRANWGIVDSMEKCQSAFSTHNEFNPANVNGEGCSMNNQNSCAIGELAFKHGKLSVGIVPNEQKMYFRDTNLPLSGENQIKDMVLVISPESNSSVTNICAYIKICAGLSASAGFSDDGVSGLISFSQRSSFDVTDTTVNLKGLHSDAKGYHVHKWPRPVTLPGIMPCSADYVSGHLNPYNVDTQQNYPPPDTSTDDEYETGDLSSKYGTLENLNVLDITYKDWNLPLYGKNGITGRSVVIHKDDSTGSRWVCTNIEPHYEVVAAIAKFRDTIIGDIILTQEKGHPDAQTAIFSQLDHLYGGPTTMNSWKINSNKIISYLKLEDEQQRCQSTEPIYNPSNVWEGQSEVFYSARCSSSTPQQCKMGDLSGRNGPLTIRKEGYTDNAAENFFTDSNLPLSGPSSIIGKSLVIMNDTSGSIMACADILPLHSPMLKATFSGGPITGYVNFMQIAGYGARKTTVINTLNGLTASHKLRIYEQAPADSDTPCADLGKVYNPLDISNSTDATTDSEYPIGDLDRYRNTSEWTNYNLPLSGLTSVMGRSLVVLDSSETKVACAQILPHSMSGILQSATVTFTGDIVGTAHLNQMLYNDGSMSDTSIVMDFKNSNNSVSTEHNWHVHQMPINGDANSQSGRCLSAQGHFDPYDAIADKIVYAAECRRSSPLHCEVGDQANKLGTYNVGEGRVVYNDLDLPLGGHNSVMGRSLVVHVAQRGAPRQACGDIIPSSLTPVKVVLEHQTNLDKRDVAITYAKAIRASPEAVTIQHISDENDLTKVNVHFSGVRRELYRTRFVQVMKTEKSRQTLKPYVPKPDSGGNCKNLVSSPVLLLVLVMIGFVHLL